MSARLHALAAAKLNRDAASAAKLGFERLYKPVPEAVAKRAREAGETFDLALAALTPEERWAWDREETAAQLEKARARLARVKAGEEEEPWAVSLGIAPSSEERVRQWEARLAAIEARRPDTINEREAA